MKPFFGKKMNFKITQDRLKVLLHYDPYTGIFTSLENQGRRKIGDIAGSKSDGDDYILIKVDGYKTGAHRLAILYMTGRLPSEKTDHINGIKFDNRYCNLREVTNQMNVQNARVARKNNKTGFLGVVAQGKKFVSNLRFSGKRIYLGTHDTAEDAYKAYVEAKRIYHEGNTL